MLNTMVGKSVYALTFVYPAAPYVDGGYICVYVCTYIHTYIRIDIETQVPAPTPHKVLSQRDTAATAREESTRAGPNSRRGLT